MAIYFNKDTGFVAENTSVIREAIEKEWKKAFATDTNLPELDTDNETPAGQLIDAQTALVAENDAKYLQLANMFNPANAEGIWQDALARIYFLNRKIAMPTYVTCQAKGLNGTVIPYGALIQDANGYTYVNTAAVTISGNGTATLLVRNSEYGAIPAPKNSITKIITAIPGWDSVNNSADGILGRDEETQSDFENRRRQSVAKNSHGAVASLYGSLSDLNNVVAVAIMENTTNQDITLYGAVIAGHSVYISIYGGDSTDIARTIYNKLDGGCGTVGDTKVTYNPHNDDDNQPDIDFAYYIKRPEVKKMGITVNVASTNMNHEALNLAIKNSCLKNFAGDESHEQVKMGMKVYASRFYSTIMNAGVAQLDSVKLRYPADSTTLADNVVVPMTEMPSLSVDDIYIVYEQGG